MNWVGQETDYFKISDVSGYYPKMFFLRYLKIGYLLGYPKSIREMGYKQAN